MEIRLGASLRSATGTAVYLTDGERIDTGTLVTTVGNGPIPLVRKLEIELVGGKIPTDPTLRVPGYNNVWALGDAARINLRGPNSDARNTAPPTAQFAVREAKCVAQNLAAAITQKPLRPFRYQPMGALASIGNYQGVAEIAGIRISGLLAWLMWRGIYIGMLPGFSTRLRVALNWLFDYFLPRNIVQIANKESSAAHFLHYAKGDLVCKPGQLIDGFYSVISGSLESRVPNTSMGEDFVRLIGPGDHWGERSLVEDSVIQCTLVALEDSRVLLLKKSDFTNLCTALPVLDEYFKKIPQKIYPKSLRSVGSRQSPSPRFAAAKEVGR